MGGERWSGLGNFQEIRGCRKIWGMHVGDVICDISGNPSEEACEQALMILLLFVHYCGRLGYGGGRKGAPS